MRISALLALAFVAACGGSNPSPVMVPSDVYDLEAPIEANRRGELVPGDAVQVTVFGEEELTGEYPVDQNGVVVFPLLGERRVLGMAADSLEQVLVQDYREFLTDPAINVTVLRRVSVLGEVREPGLYPVDLTMSLNEALALAGGVSPNGNLNDIRLIRGTEVMLRDMEAGVPLTATPVQSGDQIFVGQRSWLSRNMALVTTLITVSASLTIALLVR